MPSGLEIEESHELDNNPLVININDAKKQPITLFI